MAYRILHCGKSIENYNKCIDEHVAGFKGNGPAEGDLIFLVVKVDNKSLCGARGVLGEHTEKKPWTNPMDYRNTRVLKQISFCEPFDVSILKSVGGTYWAVKYLQASKIIDEENAAKILDETFISKGRKTPVRF